MASDVPLVTPALVVLDASPADRDTCLDLVATTATDAGRATDSTAVRDALRARESASPTGLGSGVAVPHAQSAAVTAPTLVAARLPEGVDFGAPDGTPATLCLAILVPESARDEHHSVLRAVSRALVHDDFRERLRSAADEAAVVEALREVAACR